MSHFPFSYLLLISHTNISSHLLLPPYLHFPFVLLLILRTLPLLLSSLTSLLSRCYSSYHATPFALCIIFVH